MNRSAFWCLILLLFSGCRSYDDARILQALNQRGFGRKAMGDLNEVYTIGIGDSLMITDAFNPDNAIPPVVVRTDGVIKLPLVGEVYVNGFSTAEIEETLNERYREFYNSPRIQVFVSQSNSKFFFLRGEVAVGGRQPILRGDLTVADVVLQSATPITADLSDIYVIRADPSYPLVIPVDLEKLIEYGDARDNILIREDDIIVVNPNLAGYVRNFVQLLLAPITPLLQLAVSVRNIETIYDSFVEDRQFFVGNRGFGVGGFNQGGGGNINSFGTQASTVPPGGSGS